MFNHSQMLYVYLILIHPMFSGACPTACPFRSYSGNFIQIGWIHKHRLHIRLHIVPTNFSESINVSLLFPRLKLFCRVYFHPCGVEVVKLLVKTETGLKLLRVG